MNLADIERILGIWTDCRARFGQGGDFLFGRFGIADVMVAPVVLCFQNYGVALQTWVTDAAAETKRIEKFEHGEKFERDV